MVHLVLLPANHMFLYISNFFGLSMILSIKDSAEGFS